MPKMLFAVLVWSVLGCASDAAPAQTERDAAVGCSDISGTWLIRSHCNAALVGMPVMVSQMGCAFTTSGSFPGFSGSLAVDGKFTLSGTASGTAVMCDGMATSGQLTESCTGSCAVTLGR